MVFWTFPLQIWDSWSVTSVICPVYEEKSLQFSHCPSALLPGHTLFLELKCESFPLSMLMSKLILMSLENLWGLFNKYVEASYSSDNTVPCWTRMVLLVGLCSFSDTIFCVPVQSRDHFIKVLYNMACRIHVDRAIWYNMWFTEEIRGLFLLNSSMLNFPKWYDNNFLRCKVL